MKLLFDQNISHRIVKLLPARFEGSASVKQFHLTDSTDKAIWQFARSSDFTIVTQDSDFNDLNSLLGFPPKIIWIRTGNLRTEIIANILIDHLEELEKFLEDPNFGCFEILSLR